MTRFATAVRWDAVLQYRNGFYAVSLFIVVIGYALLSLLPEGVDLPLVIPAFLLMNLLVTTFYFVGALVLLEKDEGTLYALVTSPLRSTEYLAAKAVSLTFLAAAESLLIVAAVFGVQYDVMLLVASTAALGVLYTLIGFVAVSQYDAINRYLMPSVVYVTLLILPLLSHFGLVRPEYFLWHPVQPLLLLMRAAFEPRTLLEWVYGFGASVLWLVVTYVWAKRRFEQFVTTAAGR